jgi:hypothetical protein
MATRVRSLVAFLVMQGQQYICVSANMAPSKQCRNNDKELMRCVCYNI